MKMCISIGGSLRQVKELTRLTKVMEDNKQKEEIRKKLGERGVFMMEGIGRGTTSDVMVAIDMMDKLDAERDEAGELEYIRKTRQGRAKHAGKGIQG